MRCEFEVCLTKLQATITWTKKTKEKLQEMEGNMFELSTPIEEIEDLGEN